MKIEIDEELLPWIINALNDYEDGCNDELELDTRQNLINDLIDLFEDYND
jgi:hypothetical protein